MADMNITSSGTYKIEKNFTGTITIATSSAVTLDGTNASNLSNVKIVASSNVADLTIKNLNATNESGNVIKFGSGAGNKLTLIGTNKLKTSDIWAAVVHVGGGLTINGTGSLDVTPGSQSSGVGSNSYESSNANIVINGGRITATSDLGAGIGSGSNGSIGNITINAVSVNATSNWGKGIGAGYYGSAGKVSITIVGDTGDDVLVGTSGTDTFAYTGGNDVITNYSHEDTVHIKSGKIDSYSFDGSDLIFKIGSGSLRLNNMTNHAITVKDSSGNTTTKIYGTGYSGHEVMKRFVQSMANSKLNTKAKLDEAVKACSHFNSLQEVINQLLSDRKNASDAETFLKKYCGIFLDNADTGAVTGWDAGGLYVKTKDDLLPKKGSASYPTSTTFTKRGLTLTVLEKSTLTQQEQLVVQGIYSWWMEDAINLIEETYELRFTDKPLSIKAYVEPRPEDFAWARGGPELFVNMAHTGTLNKSDKTGNGLDGALAHEFSHVMQYNFNMFDIGFILEALASITAGWDIDGKSDLRSIVSTPARLIEAFNSNDNVAGMLFLRYLMRQAADSYNSSKSYTWKDNAYIVGTASAEFLTGSGKNMTLSAGAGNDTLTVYGEKMKVLGESGSDYILISSLASGASIDGGLGNDTIRNEGVNVTILGGAGKDSLENEGANVTIDGGSDDDQIKSHSDNIKVMGGDGNDTLLVEKTSNYNWDKSVWEDTYHDKATIDGGAGNDFIKNENSNSSIYASTGNDTVENHADKVKIQGGAGKNLLINGEFFSRGGVKVTILGGVDDDTITSSGSNSMLDGSEGNDLIHNGYYYYRDWDAYYESSYNNEHDDRLKSSSVTITGGKGNDTIINKGNNVLFQYALGDGFDYIEGFNATSTLNISGGTYTKQARGDNIIVTVGNGKITLSGAASLSKLNISNTNTSNTTNGGSTTSTLMTVTNSTKSPVTIGSAIKTVNVSSRTTAVKITGNSLANSIVGGSGSDTLAGATGNDTLTGGNGNDLFVYSAGKDFITDYAAGDKISLGAAVSKATVSGSDVVFTVGSGSLTVKNAKGKSLNMIDKSGKAFTTIVGGSTTSTLMTVTNSTKSPVTISSAIKTVDASARIFAVKITGNSEPNTILGGAENDTLLGNSGADYLNGLYGDDKLYGGIGNDTLIGNRGNDSLWGEGGNDTFIYGADDGKDVIVGFESNDLLKITGTFSATYNPLEKNVSFKVGSTVNAITLKDFTATSFNINGNVYQISGTKLVKK